MVNYIKRLIYVDAREKEIINPLYYPFIFGTFVYGIGFLCLGWWTGVSASSLYQAMYAMSPFIPAIWGLGAVMASTSAMVLLLRRKGWWGGVASISGWLVWLFAAIVYAMEGYWLVFFTVTLVYGYFWAYYYLEVKKYQRQKKLGLIQDPE